MAQPNQTAAAAAMGQAPVAHPAGKGQDMGGNCRQALEPAAPISFPVAHSYISAIPRNRIIGSDRVDSAPGHKALVFFGRSR
jgi:hypothetical protein